MLLLSITQAFPIEDLESSRKLIRGLRRIVKNLEADTDALALGVAGIPPGMSTSRRPSASTS